MKKWFYQKNVFIFILFFHLKIICFVKKFFKKRKIKNIKKINYFFIFLFFFFSKAYAVDYIVPPDPPQAGTLHLLGANPDTLTVLAGGTYNSTTPNATSVQMDGRTTTTNFGTILGGTPAAGGIAIISSTFFPNDLVNITNNSTGLISYGAASTTAQAIQTRDATTVPGTYSAFNITNSGHIAGMSIFSNSNLSHTINNLSGGLIQPVSAIGQVGIFLGRSTEPTNNLQTITFNNASGATISGTLGGNAIWTVGGVVGTTTVIINNNGSIIGGIVNDSLDPNFRYILNAGSGSVQGTYVGVPTTLNQFNVVAGAGGTFTQTNPILGIHTIDVQSGTFNATNTISNFTTFRIRSGTTTNHTAGAITGVAGSTFTIDAGGTLISNGGTISATTITNNGTHYIPTTGVITIRNVTGNYISTGTFRPEIISPTNYSRLNVIGGPATISGTVNVSLPAGLAGIPPGTFYDVLTTTPGALTFGGVVLPPYFTVDTSVIPLGILRLIAGFQNANTNPLTACLAHTLDTFILGGAPTANLQALINAILALPSPAAFQSALESLLPSVNQGLIAKTITLDQLFLDHITNRLDMIRLGVDLVEQGYSAGDIGGGLGSYGPIFYAGQVKQSDVDGFRGYHATTAGAALVADSIVRCYGKLGIGISVSNTVIKPGAGTNVNFGNSINYYSIMPLIYGGIDYCGMFIDAFIGGAYNQYRTIRNMPFINQTATGKFYGVLTTGAVRVGAIIPISTLQFTPIAGVRYNHLRQHAYTETGAPFANLSISGNRVTGTQGFYGFKIIEVSSVDFYPELHAYYVTDIKRPVLQLTARFAEGGPACTDEGATPARNGVEVGGSLSFLLPYQMLLTFNFDAELRQKFTGYSGWIRVRWLYE